MVSVIIPVYNSAAFIYKAVYSVIEQNVDLEIVIVDDCSSDGTPEILEKLKKKFPNILVVRNSVNLGVSKSRNIAISLAKGEFIAFLDADDFWYPHKLSSQLTLFQDPETGLVYSGYCLHDVQKNKKVIYYPSIYEDPNIFIEKLFIKNFIAPSTVVCRKELLYKVGLFRENLRFAEDWDLWLRLARITKFKAINEILVERIEHDNNLSKNIENMLKSSLNIVEDNLREYSFDLLKSFWLRRMSYSNVYLLAAQAYRNIDRLKTAYYALLSIFYCPLKIGPQDDKYILLMKACLPRSFIKTLKFFKKSLL